RRHRRHEHHARRRHRAHPRNRRPQSPRCNRRGHQASVPRRIRHHHSRQRNRRLSPRRRHLSPAEVSSPPRLRSPSRHLTNGHRCFPHDTYRHHIIRRHVPCPPRRRP